MLMPVTANTEGDQVLQRVVPELTTRLQMMDLQVALRTTALTTPAISFQHTPSQHFVFLPI